MKSLPASRHRAAAAIAGAGSIPVTRCPAATSRAAHRPTPQPTSTTSAGAAPTTAAQISQASSSYARRCGAAKCAS